MRTQGFFPIIEASGTPYELGLAHGKGAKKQIDVSINTYKDMFMTYSNISWEKAKQYASTFVEEVQKLLKK